MSGKGRGSKKSTFIWTIVWKHFWSKNRCLQILLRKICLCKLKIYLCYTFLAETAKPVEYFLVEARSSSGKLEKKHGTKKELNFTFFEEKSIWFVFSWHALTLGSHPTEKICFRNSSSVILLHFRLLLYLSKKTKDEFCSIVWWRFIFWKTCSI